MKVPFLDIKAQNASIWDELSRNVDGVIRDARFILGPAVAQFERHFAEYVGTDFCVGLNSGTSAIQMALIASDIGPGDEVITTPHTWISTSWAIRYVGAKPVFVDIDPWTYTIDARLVETAITSRTKAILPVHLYGQAADMAPLKDLAVDRNLVLIEDAAQAHGAVVDGRRVGSIGEVGCFSFYPGKNLGAFGEGGAITTDNEQIADRIRRLRDHAQDGRHNHVELGFNARMEGIQGAVLSVKLLHLDRWNSIRRQLAARYSQLLADVDGLELPSAPNPDAHVWHLFVALLRDHDVGHVRRELNELGIATGVHYPVPVPFQPAFSDLGYQPGDFPVAEDVMCRCFSLPMSSEVNEEQIEYVAESLKSVLARQTADVGR